MYGLDPASEPPSIQEYLDYVHPQDRESMANLIKGTLAKASPFDATKRIVRPNGEGNIRELQNVGHTLRNGDFFDGRKLVASTAP